MNKKEFSLDIDMSKADMSKLKDLLTSKLGLRHFAFQLKTGEYLDLVEYKDYEKLEKELEQLKEIEKEHQKMNGDLRVENKELKKQYCERTDCGGRLGNSKKVEQLIKENQELKGRIKTYEEPEDLTLMFMYCDEKAKDKIKELQDRIDKAFEIIDLIKPELWNISNKMTYRLLDVKTTLKGGKQ